jgi:hypothetical protein
MKAPVFCIIFNLLQKSFIIDSNEAVLPFKRGSFSDVSNLSKFYGATTFSITALSIMTLSITALSITTFSIMILSVTTFSIMTLNITTLSITTFSTTTLNKKGLFATLGINDIQHNDTHYVGLICDTQLK